MRHILAVAVAAYSVLCCTPATSQAQEHTIAAPSPSPSPGTREALSDAWWTGPLLAPSAGTLPRGHVLVEPYLYDVIQYANYDRNGAITPAPHANDLGSLTYLIYGLTDRLSVGAIPTFGYNAGNEETGSGVGIGDLGVLAQYRLSQYQPGGWMPTASIAVQETFPTGAYENLDDHPSGGFGSGTYSTKVSLYTQSYAWMPNGRIVRLRLNLSQTFGGGASIDGVSVYGTGRGYHGSVEPGGSTTIDAAQEYSITRSWVFASDLVYEYGGNTRLEGTTGTIDLGATHSFAFAPAVEYNWTANSGIIVGLRLLPSGRGTAASITPAIAVNMVR
jgi:hypothetical protein